ncbi:hypothetical protein JYT60_01990 [bacterium AH-315-C08]|nr:hypothetical protein [bacterium AH-315-C08]
MEDELIYSLSEDDAQTVAIEELGRKLSSDEMHKLKDMVAEKINWFDAISDTLSEIIPSD